MDTNKTEVMELIEKHTQLFNNMAQKILFNSEAHDNDPVVKHALFNPNKLGKLLNKNIKLDSQKLIQKQMSFMQQQTQLWQQASKALMSRKPLEKENVDSKSNFTRFTRQHWQESPVYKYMKESYLLNAEMMNSIIDRDDFADEKQNQQNPVFSRQHTNSLSPSNFVMSKPEVCEEILKSKGQNQIKGMKNFLEDVKADSLVVVNEHQTNNDDFTLGENVAYTKGNVVFENEVMQLIHYCPTKAKHYATPVLITPSFINKYYVLDLDEKKSLVKGLLDGGYAVFMISWVNPSAEFSEYTFTDYMTNGPLVALEQIKMITDQTQVSLCGFGVGGTLCATLAAFLRGIGDESVASLTLLNTLLDFSEPGEEGDFFSEEKLLNIEKRATVKGVFDGRIIGINISLLRENNLFWSFFIDKYLHGQDPTPADILYWHRDATNIPAACLKQYLHATYWEDKLKVPGGLTILGVPVDLSKIDIPTYFLSTVADHIALWESAYQGTKLLSGSTRFVLADSGHIAGVINPIEGGKYPHWVNDELPETAEQWFNNAKEQQGSWWSDWHKWMKKTSGKQIKGLIPGSKASHPSLMDAPGTYVLRRVE